MKKGGLIGFGYWGQILSKTLKKTEPTLSLCVFDISKKAQREAVKRNFQTASSLNELLSSNEISFLIVATPPHSHLPLVEKGLRAGKHILVEKPFGFCSQSKQTAFDLAETKKKVLMLDYTYRYSPGFQALKNHLKNTKMTSYESLRMGAGLARKDINVLEDLMIHDLSMLIELAPSKPLSCSCLPLNPETTLQQAFVTVSGKNWQASLLSSRVFPKKIRTVVVRTLRSVVQFEEEGGKTFVSVFNKNADSLKSKNTEIKTSLENMFSEFFKRINTGEWIKDKDAHTLISYLLKKLNKSMQLKGQNIKL